MITAQPTMWDYAALQQAIGRAVVQQETAVVFADGGSRGNPGPAGAGAVIVVNGNIVESVKRYCGIATNNVAEYTGLVIGLEKAIELGFSQVEVRMDSELIVKQMLGEYKVKNENLIPLYYQALNLSKKFGRFSIVHVRREHNKDADRMANEAMDEGYSVPPSS